MDQKRRQPACKRCGIPMIGMTPETDLYCGGCNPITEAAREASDRILRREDWWRRWWISYENIRVYERLNFRRSHS